MNTATITAKEATDDRDRLVTDLYSASGSSLGYGYGACQGCHDSILSRAAEQVADDGALIASQTKKIADLCDGLKALINQIQADGSCLKFHGYWAARAALIQAQG
jgi:hypothetical protein